MIKYDKNIYEIDVKSKMNKKKIAIIVLIILSISCILITMNYVNNTMQQYKVYKQYEAQLNYIENQKREKEEKEEKQAALEEKKRKAKIPQLTEKGKDNIKNIYHSDNKRAFLTFDDGPSAVTPQILDILKQENIKATFFVLGSNVDARKDIVKRIYDEGHYIANHGNSHVYSQIYVSPQSVLDEFNQCNEKVRNAIGVPEYNSHLFRFPGGLIGGKYAELKQQAAELLSQNEIVNIDWNSLNGDAETNNLSSEFEMQRLQQTTQDKNTLVILMHDAQAKSVTADTLPQIISYLREQGYEFKNFYDIIK